MKKIGRLIYRLAMALCVLILIMTQDINLESDLWVPYLVAFLFGDMSWFSRIIFALVGLSGLYMLSFFGRIRSAMD